MDDDDFQLEVASGWPMGGLHGAGVALHALNGALVAGVLLLGPTLHDMMGEPLTTPRVYGAGLAVFAAVLSIGFSSGLAVVVYRTVALYPRWSAKRQQAARIGGLVLAHGIGCLMGLGGVVAMVTTTFLG